MQKSAKVQSTGLVIALGMTIIVVGIAVAVAINPMFGVWGAIAVLALVLLARVAWWLRKHLEWLYSLMLWSDVLARAFLIEGEATLVRDGLKAVGYGIAMVLVVLALSRVLRRPATLQLVPADLFLVSLLGWQFLALFEAENLRNTLVGAFANTLVILTCVYGLRIFLRERPQVGERFLVFWHLTGLFVAGAGMILIVTGPIQIGPFQFGDYEIRNGLPYMSSIFDWTNAVGTFTYIGLVATYVLWRRSHKLYLLLSGIVIGSALFLSFSRAGYLGLAVGGLIVFWKQTPLWLKMVILVVLVVGAGVAYNMIKNDAGWAYAFKLGTGLSGRDEIWSGYTTFIRESPYVGIGSINIYLMVQRGGILVRQFFTPHNAYLGIAMSSGYVGLGLFVCAQITMMAMAVWGQRLKTNLDPWIAWGGLAMAVAISVQQFFESRLFAGLDYTHMSFWIALTLAMMPLLRLRSAKRLTGSVESDESSTHDVGAFSL